MPPGIDNSTFDFSNIYTEYIYTVKPCPSQVDPMWGILWPKTKPDKRIVLPCPMGFIGIVYNSVIITHVRNYFMIKVRYVDAVT